MPRSQPALSGRDRPKPHSAHLFPVVSSLNITNGDLNITYGEQMGSAGILRTPLVSASTLRPRTTMGLCPADEPIRAPRTNGPPASRARVGV